MPQSVKPVNAPFRPRIGAKENSEGPVILGTIKGDRCTCLVRVGNQRYRALIDSGASASVISKRTFQQVKSPLAPSKLTLKTVSGQGLRVLGETCLHVTLGTHKLRHTFQIIENVDNPLILGLDFLTKHQLQLNFSSKRSIKIQNEEIPLEQESYINSFVRLNETRKIDPQSSTIVMARCKKYSHECSPVALISQVKSGFIAREPGLMITNAVVKVSGHKTFPINVVNNTNKTFTLRKGNVVATAVCADECTINALTHEVNDRSLPNTSNICPLTLEDLLEQNNDLFAKTDSDLSQTHLITMKIDTQGCAPISLKPYRVPFNKRKVINDQIDNMLEAKVIRPSRSPWSFPVVIVSKKDGGDRCCIDFRRLNAQTKRNSYPLGNIDDILSALGRSKVYSSLDLKSGYWQIPLDPADKEKTAFTTFRGLYEWNVMPFGLCNAPSIFSELMAKVVGDLGFTIAYLDDLIIFSENKEDHLKHLSIVFDRLRQANLRMKRSKCDFFKEELRYLGHVINKEGIMTDPSKIEAITDMPAPRSVREVRSFVGTTSYYRKFIPDFAKIAQPLTALTRKHANFHWDETCEASFQRLKAALASSPVLAFPDMSLPFTVYSDASDTCIGAVLTQNFPEGERPIQYMSQQLSTTQRKWPILEKECFAIVTALEKFDVFLHGSQFKVMCDHRPLQYIFSAKMKNPKVQRWALTISATGCDIEYLAGKKNTKADMLSRLPPVNESIAPINVINTDVLPPKLIRDAHEKYWKSQESVPDPFPLCPFPDFDRQQAKDPMLREIRDNIASKTLTGSKALSYVMHKNILYYVPYKDGKDMKLLVPEGMRHIVLEALHTDNCHQGMERTYDIIREKYHWQGMYLDIVNYVSDCVTCQTRTLRKDVAPLQEMDTAKFPNEKVAIDTVGPYPESHAGNKYLITFIDQYSGWPELFPTKDKSAQTVARILLEEYIPRHSVMLCLKSDNGTEFVNNVLEHVCEKYNVLRVKTSSYHPAGNAQVERMHRVWNDILSKQLDKDPRNWDTVIPSALMALRTSPNASSKSSPHFLLYGRDPILPLDTLLQPQLKYMGEEYHKVTMQRQHEAFKAVQRNVRKARTRQKKYHDKKAREVHLEPGDPVYLYNNRKQGKWDKKWIPYYRIMKKNSPVNYTIKSATTGAIQNVHVEMLKLAKLDWVTPPTEMTGRAARYAVPPSGSDSEDGSHSEPSSSEEGKGSETEKRFQPHRQPYMIERQPYVVDNMLSQPDPDPDPLVQQTQHFANLPAKRRHRSKSGSSSGSSTDDTDDSNAPLAKIRNRMIRKRERREQVVKRAKTEPRSSGSESSDPEPKRVKIETTLTLKSDPSTPVQNPSTSIQTPNTPVQTPQNPVPTPDPDAMEIGMLKCSEKEKNVKDLLYSLYKML